jgi:hypothetical protein
VAPTRSDRPRAQPGAALQDQAQIDRQPGSPGRPARASGDGDRRAAVSGACHTPIAGHVQFSLVTSPAPVQYKGEPLEPERGPGLGCFRFQLIVLAIAIILTPLSVAWKWPEWLSAALLILVIVLLLFAGQTIIFLLRLVAADRRARRRPLGSQTKTVGELEDEAPGPADPTEPTPDDEGPVRQ